MFSLLEQTFDRWRCIVIDSSSGDGSWKIIQSFAAKDSTFEIYQLLRNGLYHSLNFEFTKVTNPYFGIFNNDDLWDKNWFQVAVSSLENNSNWFKVDNSETALSNVQAA